MKDREFDRDFDEGKDVSKDLNLSKIRRPGQEQRRVNVDFPTWMIETLDREAKFLGVTRQSIATWGVNLVAAASWRPQVMAGVGSNMKWRYPGGEAR